VQNFTQFNQQTGEEESGNAIKEKKPFIFLLSFMNQNRQWETI
jgi:hypothetical protein